MNKVSTTQQVNNTLREGYHYHNAKIDKDGDFVTCYSDGKGGAVTYVKEIKDNLAAEVMAKLIEQLTPNQKAMMKGHTCWTQFTIKGEQTADEVIAAHDLYIVVEANNEDHSDYVEFKTKIDRRFDLWNHVELIGKDGSINEVEGK